MTETPEDGGEVIGDIPVFSLAEWTNDLGTVLDDDEGGELKSNAFTENVPHLTAEEETRREALRIISALLFTVLILACVMVFWNPSTERWSEAREFLEITFVPLIALLGGTLAYYASSK